MLTLAMVQEAKEKAKKVTSQSDYYKVPIHPNMLKQGLETGIIRQRPDGQYEIVG